MITASNINELHRLRVQADSGWQVETVPQNFHHLKSGMIQT